MSRDFAYPFYFTFKTRGFPEQIVECHCGSGDFFKSKAVIFKVHRNTKRINLRFLAVRYGEFETL